MGVYNGVIGKLQTSIFSGTGRGAEGIARYAAVGGAVGAIGGALSSDDGYAVGAMRGAAFGSLAGVGVNMLPKYISSTYKSTGFKSWDNSLNSSIGNEAHSIFKSTYDQANTAQNKAILKDFVPKAQQAWKKPNAREFSLDVTHKLLDDVSGFDAQGIENIKNLGSSVESNMSSWNASKSKATIQNWFDTNKDIYKGLSTGQKAHMINSVGMKGGFDSAYHHIVEPTAELFKNIKSKNWNSITKGQAAAGAFSAYGVYEASEIMHDVSNGNYSGAAGGMGKLVLGKLAFSQAGNLIKANSFLKEKGMTWSGVGRAGGGGIAAQRFFKGTKDWTVVDDLGILEKMNNIGMKNMMGATP